MHFVQQSENSRIVLRRSTAKLSFLKDQGRLDRPLDSKNGGQGKKWAYWEKTPRSQGMNAFCDLSSEKRPKPVSIPGRVCEPLELPQTETALNIVRETGALSTLKTRVQCRAIVPITYENDWDNRSTIKLQP